MEQLKTKDKILYAALDLFAEKGYDGVGIDQIAAAVGIKGPSIYRHFKSKEEIFDAMTQRVSEHYSMQFGTSEHPGKVPESTEELVELSLKRIHFTMHDPMVRKIRRVLAMEQFRSPQIAELASQHHLEGISTMFAQIFEGMMQKELLKGDDAQLLAIEFVAPVSLLIHAYDRQSEREQEIMELIEKHIRHFVKSYGV